MTEIEQAANEALAKYEKGCAPLTPDERLVFKLGFCLGIDHGCAISMAAMDTSDAIQKARLACR